MGGRVEASSLLLVTRKARCFRSALHGLRLQRGTPTVLIAVARTTGVFRTCLFALGRPVFIGWVDAFARGQPSIHRFFFTRFDISDLKLSVFDEGIIGNPS